ncbi:MAG TPA: tetratricopeptide repeat protein, partial [Burkholderiaceae bacterium]
RYIEQLSARKQALGPLLLAVDAQNWEKVVEVAEQYIQRTDSLGIEGIKQKGLALMRLARFEEARDCYSTALQLNSELPWALLGRAQAHRALGELGEARAELQKLNQSHPEYAAAYDHLLELAEERGDLAGALEIANRLAELVPNSRRRIKLGELALNTGDAEQAVKALDAAVAKNKSALKRSPHEGMLLAQALIDKGDAARAIAVANEQAKDFDEPGAKLLGKALHAQALQALGQHHEAAQMMAEVEHNAAEMGGALSGEHKLLLARSAIATGRLEMGQALVDEVIRNNTDQPMLLAATMQAVKGTPVESACRDSAEKAGVAVNHAMQELQSAKRSGDWAQAIAIGEAALKLSPQHFSVLIELCTLYLIAMKRLGKEQEHAARAKELLGQLEANYPNRDRVAVARRFYRERVPK